MDYKGDGWERGPYWLDAVSYTHDAADDSLRVDLGGRRIIKKKKKKTYHVYNMENKRFLFKFRLFFSNKLA